jgi:hypothetical protein
VTKSTRVHRSRFRLLTAALVATAQFAVVAFGPLVDASEGASAPSHVEETGTRLHYSHNPDNCAACAAATLVGDSPRTAAVLPLAEILPATTSAVSPALVAIRDGTPKSPRAPPRPASPAR